MGQQRRVVWLSRPSDDQRVQPVVVVYRLEPAQHRRSGRDIPRHQYDVGGRDNPSTTPISGFKSITSTFSELNSTAGGWDAAYDLWTNNWSNETMIWNQWAGDNAFWANCASAANSTTFCGTEQGVALTLNGVPYHFLANGPQNANGTPIPCTAKNEGDCEYMFFRRHAGVEWFGGPAGSVSVGGSARLRECIRRPDTARVRHRDQLHERHRDVRRERADVQPEHVKN